MDADNRDEPDAEDDSVFVDDCGDQLELSYVDLDGGGRALRMDVAIGGLAEAATLQFTDRAVVARIRDDLTAYLEGAADLHQEWLRSTVECIGLPHSTKPCGWKGKGADAAMIDGVSERRQCPTCGGDVEAVDEEPVAEETGS